MAEPSGISRERNPDGSEICQMASKTEPQLFE